MVSKEIHLNFRLAADLISRNSVFCLRESVYQNNMNYLLNLEEESHLAEDKFDSSSFLFYAHDYRHILATCRWTTNLLGSWELTSLCSNHNLPTQNSDELIESSRLVISPEIRNIGVAEVMVYFSCVWLSRYTRFTSYFAVCSPALARFYKHFGLTVMSHERVCLKGRGNKKYLVIYGDIKESINILHDYLIQRKWFLSLKYAIFPWPCT